MNFFRRLIAKLSKIDWHMADENGLPSDLGEYK